MAHIEKGAYIVPKYDKYGKRLSEGKWVGSPEEIAELKAKYNQHAGSKGKPVLTLAQQEAAVVAEKETKKKSRKPKAKAATPVAPKPFSAESYMSVEEAEFGSTTTSDSQMAAYMGETPVATTPTATAAPVTDWHPYEEPVKIKSVGFHNLFGMTRVKVIDILESKDDAIALIFASDDDVTFIPKVGESLILTTPDGKERIVFFPGSVFCWTDGVKQIMILHTVPDNFEDEPDNGTTDAADADGE